MKKKTNKPSPPKEPWMGQEIEATVRITMQADARLSKQDYVKLIQRLVRKGTGYRSARGGRVIVKVTRLREERHIYGLK